MICISQDFSPVGILAKPPSSCDDPQRIYTGAAATLTIYDWMIVFDIGTSSNGGRINETHTSLEYQNIYQSRWTLPKALFYYVSATWSHRLPRLNAFQIRLITPPGIIFGAFRRLNYCYKK
jgi:hypothetical protein